MCVYYNIAVGILLPIDIIPHVNNIIMMLSYYTVDDEEKV